MIGVSVRFEYDGDFDRDRVVNVADKARAMFEGMPGLRFKFFTFDEKAAARDQLLRLGVQRCCRCVLLGRAARTSYRPLRC